MPKMDDTLSGAEPLGETGSANRAFSLAEWLKRELPKPDLLLGDLLSTTSRILAYAETGVGKTMMFIAMFMRATHGCGFLHWPGGRPARVLYVDGEMPRELLQERLRDESARLGAVPEHFYILSKEDCLAMGPLNTPEGQQFIDKKIEELGGRDFIVFDNIMALLAGSMKDEESWQQTLPWVQNLTRKCIGQMWIHHTGHDTSHSYGTKTLQWQMDTVIRLEAIARPDTDVSFVFSCKDKARRRKPTNRQQFEDIRVALVDNEWIYQRTSGSTREHVSPLSMKFYEALVEATSMKEVGKDMFDHPVVGDKPAQMYGNPAATIEQWQRMCVHKGLIEAGADGKFNGADRAKYSRHRLELISANWIACNETMAWVLL